LDKILRDGVFAGHHHASQHTRIVRVLMQKAAAVVNCMGIYSIKHLSVCSMYSLKDLQIANSAAPATSFSVIIYHDRPFCSFVSSNPPSNNTTNWRDHC
jgi:hypothetical protein